MRSSLLFLLLSATAGSASALGAERTFTIDDRQYRFDFPSEIKFEGGRADVSADGLPIKIVDFSTPPSVKEYFKIHFAEVDASVEQVAKGYVDIEEAASPEERSANGAHIERADGFYRLKYDEYDDFRTMDILVARSRCPSDCAIAVQFLYFRENPYGFGAAIVDGIKAQLLSGAFLAR